MNVLFLDHARTFVSGAELRLLDLAQALPRHGVTPLVAADPASPLAARARALGVGVVPVIVPELQANWPPHRMLVNAVGLARAVRGLRDEIRARGADVVHANTMLARLPGLLAARAAGRPVVWHVRDFVVQPHWRRLYAALASRVDRIVTVSDACGSDFAGHPRMRTIYNGLDPARYRVDRAAARAETGYPDGLVAIGLVGLLEPWKGHHVLLEAAARLRRETSLALRFVVAGAESPRAPGEQARLAREAARLGVQADTVIAGFVSDVPRLLASLDVAVLPSLRPDPLPGALLEAMAAGLPVVASRTGGIPEIVEHERTGFLVPPGDAGALAGRLRQLAESAELREAMGRAGRQRIERRFRLDTNVRELVALYRELQPAGGAAARRRRQTAGGGAP